MKSPTSKGSGTTGAWKSFSEAFNRVGNDTAEKRRKQQEALKKMQKDKKNKKWHFKSAIIFQHFYSKFFPIILIALNIN